MPVVYHSGSFSLCEKIKLSFFLLDCFFTVMNIYLSLTAEYDICALQKLQHHLY